MADLMNKSGDPLPSGRFCEISPKQQQEICEGEKRPKLPKVGYVRISRNLKTLIITVTENGKMKVFLMFTDDMLDLIGGYRSSAIVVQGSVFRETKTFLPPSKP